MVIFAHQFKIGNRKVHPYFFFADFSIAAVLVFTFIFSCYHEELSFLKLGLIYLMLYFTYEVYIMLKRKFFGVRSRTFMQDFVFYIFPCYILGINLFDIEINIALDLLAFNTALVISITRLGCFFGGCCHGKKSKIGVCYPKHILKRIEHPRKYRPSNYFDIRVFPLQLLESLFCMTIFLILGIRKLILNDDSILNINGFMFFILLYCSFRLFTDFIKMHRGTKKIGIFSQSQIISIILICFCVLLIVFN